MTSLDTLLENVPPRPEWCIAHCNLSAVARLAVRVSGQPLSPPEFQQIIGGCKTTSCERFVALGEAAAAGLLSTEDLNSSAITWAESRDALEDGPSSGAFNFPNAGVILTYDYLTQ